MNREGPSTTTKCDASCSSSSSSLHRQPRTHATHGRTQTHRHARASAITTTGDGGRRVWAEQPRLSWRVSERAQRTDEEEQAAGSRQ